MFIERPLASLPATDAERFVRAIAPDCADPLIDKLADPTLHTIGVQTVAASWRDAGGPAAYKPIGMFGYCELDAHPLGARIAGALPHRFEGPFGLAHTIGILDATCGVDLEETIFLWLAHAAHTAGHRQLVVVTDRLRAERYGRFGIELFPGVLHNRSTIVGVFDLAERRTRLDQFELCETAMAA